jgi:hypothetical protein
MSTPPTPERTSPPQYPPYTEDLQEALSQLTTEDPGQTYLRPLHLPSRRQPVPISVDTTEDDEETLPIFGSVKFRRNQQALGPLPEAATLVDFGTDLLFHPPRIEYVPRTTYQPAFKRTIVSPPTKPTMSSSLRQQAPASADVPDFTLTKHVTVNHELLSLKAIWDTLHDFDDGHGIPSRLGQTDAAWIHRIVDNNRLIKEHIKKRVAILQIGGRQGWASVPGTTLSNSYIALGTDAAAAGQLAARPAVGQRGFRGSPRSNRGGRGGRGAPKS